MNTKDINTSSSSCFWIPNGKDIRLKSPYPDRYAVNSEDSYYPSSKEFLLDLGEDEEVNDSYKLRCVLFKECGSRIENSIRSEIKHTTDKCVSLVKQFLACLSKNYCESQVLPICLVLLDSQTYKHEKSDLFGLESYCSSVLHHSFIEIDELTGYDKVKDAIESLDETNQLDVYLYQSEFHKNNNTKDIIEYCLSCRINQKKKINLIVEWNCFPEEFGNLLQRSITANCVIQPVLFPSTLQLLNNSFEQLIIHHQLPFSFPFSFLSSINATLINYDFSIWSWAKALEYYTWTFFSYQPASVLCQELLKQEDRQKTQKTQKTDKPVEKETKLPEKSSVKRPSENRYELRKKNQGRYGVSMEEKESGKKINPVKSLKGVLIPGLSEAQRKGKKIKYDETIIHSILNMVSLCWEAQAKFTQLLQTIAIPLIGNLSLREIYCQLVSEKRPQLMDVYCKLQTAFKSLQDRSLFERLLKEVDMFTDSSLVKLPEVYAIVKKAVEKCQQEYERSKQEQPSSVTKRMEELKKIHNREELKKQLQKQKDENSAIRQSVKDLFFTVISQCITSLFNDKTYQTRNKLFQSPNPPRKSTLTLANRRTVIEGVMYSSHYYECDCCKNDNITASNDDITILYNLFISLGKVIEVNELRKQFFSYFGKEEREVTEARFWDSLTTLQYLGFLELNANEDRVMKLDFAICIV